MTVPLKLEAYGASQSVSQQTASEPGEVMYFSLLAAAGRTH